jgi:NADPH-dependent curcumin reductase CurA
MRLGPSYAAPWEVGEVMKGGAVGRVVESRSPDVPEGALVLTDAAWRDVAVLDARAGPAAARDARTCPSPTRSASSGCPGLTAYAGLFRVAAFREGDAVFVSGAAGRGGQRGRASSPGCAAPRR